MTDLNDLRLRIINTARLEGSVARAAFVQVLAKQTAAFDSAIDTLLEEHGDTPPEQIERLCVSFGNALHDLGVGTKAETADSLRAETHRVLMVSADALAGGQRLPDNAASALASASSLG